MMMFQRVIRTMQVQNVRSLHLAQEQSKNDRLGVGVGKLAVIGIRK